MPELAEVALYARDLSKITQAQKVLKVTFPNQADWGATIIPAVMKKKLRSIVGKKVFFESAGKALFMFSHDNELEPLLEFRLGMTGQFQLTKKPGKWKRHYFLSIKVGNNEIHYADPRRFGRTKLPKLSTHALGGYKRNKGFWTRKDIVLPDGYLKTPKISWLLTNGDKTGVGNYMANEALGLLNLSPFTPCRDEKEARAILKKCREIAAKSFIYGGNSFGSGYYLLSGAEGGFGEHCKYYGKTGICKSLFKGRPVFSKYQIPNKVKF
jgi:formamidopyrimidine-DNA glycosylase